MIVNKDKPKIYDALVKKFHINWDQGIIVSYYPDVHCKFDLPDFKVAHESVHLKQQEAIGVNEWWKKYFDDVKFRLKQEVEAYRAEWHFVQENVSDKNRQFALLFRMCKDLSSPMYGGICTYSKAKDLITK